MRRFVPIKVLGHLDIVTFQKKVSQSLQGLAIFVPDLSDTAKQ